MLATRPRILASLALLILSSCAGKKPPPPPPPEAPPPKAAPCDQAKTLRASVAALHAAGKLSRAERVIEKADRLCPENASESWRAYLAVSVEIGHYNEAKDLIRSIEKAVNVPSELKTAAAETKERLAELEQKLGDNAAKGKGEKSRAAAKKLAQEAEATSDPKKALEKYNQSIEEWPTQNALIGAAMAARKAGNKIEAQRLVDRAVVFAERAEGKLVSLEVPNGFAGWVTAVAWSPNGKRMAVAHGEGVSILDTSTYRELVHITGLTKPRSLAFSPDGTQIVTGSDDRHVRLWDAVSGSLLQDFAEHTAEITAVAFSPNGKLVASTSKDATVKLWDPIKGGPSIRALTDHLAETTAVTFSPNGKWLATGSLDNTARLWDASTGSSIRTLAEHTVWVSGVAFSPDNKWLATSSWDNSVRLWEINPRQPDQASKKPTKVFGEHKDRVATVAFSPDGKKIATAGWDKTVQIWDPATMATQKTLTGHTLWVTSVAFSPDGKQLASGSWDTTVRLWDPAAGTPIRTLKEIADRVSLAAFSPDGKQIAASSPDRTVRLWSPEGGAFQTAPYEDYVGALKADALSPARNLRVSATTDGVLVLSHPTESRSLATMRTIEGKNSGYVLSSDNHVDFMGSEPCVARALPICRVGAVSLPFEFCEDRFYTPGLLGKLMTNDRSYSEPEVENEPMSCPN
ncbi:MAG: hypothetical protein U0359_31445 [Byssovorax sp.]